MDAMATPLILTPEQQQALVDDEAAQRLVDDWTTKMLAINRNMMDLNESPMAKNLRMRKDYKEEYTGETGKVAKMALEDLDGLWDNYILVGRALEEAQEICKPKGFFGRQSKTAAAKKLLDYSIELPKVYVPIAERSLLSGAERTDRACPQMVLDSMIQSFTRTRDALASIEKAEETLSQSVQQAKNEASSLASWAKSLGAGDAAVSVEALAKELADDPITASAKLASARKAIEAERERLAAFQREAAALDDDFAQAKVDLGALRDLSSRAALAIDETKQKILPPWSFAQPEGKEAADALEEWLRSVEQARQLGKVAAAKIGLANWRVNCKARTEQAQRVYAQNRRALDEREDLKGRFRAMEAKAKAMAARGANQSAWAQVQRDADETLAYKPVDLPKARRLVEAFETSVLTATRSM
jgi:hypothetical protein